MLDAVDVYALDAYVSAMTEQDFLAGYDPAAFTPLAVVTDVVLFAVVEGQLSLLLPRRREHPARGRLALPGCFVRADEDLDEAARRTCRDKLGVDTPVRQFRSFGRVDRDPRMRIVSIGYMALLTGERAASLVDDDHQLATLRDDVWRGPNGRRLALPFDHDEIVGAALEDLRANLDHSAWSFGLLPPAFSLRELQQVHEAIRGRPLNKPAFRKRLIESVWIEPTGEMETGKGFRPAELYRLREEHRDGC
jgi:8-oxo-dGTP diphosphatase